MDDLLGGCESCDWVLNLKADPEILFLIKLLASASSRASWSIGLISSACQQQQQIWTMDTIITVGNEFIFVDKYMNWLLISNSYCDDEYEQILIPDT